MKARAFKRVDEGWMPCEVAEATHIELNMPAIFSYRILPIILKGSRDKHPRSPVWSWNGDLEKPTLKPSIKTTTNHGDVKGQLCHSWVTDGKVKYLDDCTHEYANQTLDLLDIE